MRACGSCSGSGVAPGGGGCSRGGGASRRADRLVAEPPDRAQAVAHDQDRPRLGAELAHLPERLAPEARVADRQRLVDQEDVGLHVDGDREREPAVHPGRVRAHRHVHELAKLGELRDLLVLRGHLLAGQTGRQAAEDDVVPTGEPSVEADAEREQRAHAPVHLDAARGRREDARDVRAGGSTSRRRSRRRCRARCRAAPRRRRRGPAWISRMIRVRAPSAPAPSKRRPPVDERPVGDREVLDLDGAPVAGSGSSARLSGRCSEADSELTLPGDEEEGAGDERDGGPGSPHSSQTGSGWRPLVHDVAERAEHRVHRVGRHDRLQLSGTSST